jgi:hypothetical protein
MARQKQDLFEQFVPKAKEEPTTEIEKQAQVLLADRFNRELHQKMSKLTVEETHTRTTFLLRNDLKARLANLSDQHKRGYKTEFINQAIEQLLDAIENQQK